MNMSNKRKLQVVQNSALRVVSCMNKCYSATVLHHELAIEWLDVQWCKSMCNEVYKFTNGIGPKNLVHEFEPIIPEHALTSNIKIIHSRDRTQTKFAENDPVFRGKKYSASLPQVYNHVIPIVASRHVLGLNIMCLNTLPDSSNKLGWIIPVSDLVILVSLLPI